MIYDPRLTGSKFRDPKTGRVVEAPRFFKELQKSELKFSFDDLSEEVEAIKMSEEAQERLRQAIATEVPAEAVGQAILELIKSRRGKK